MSQRVKAASKVLKGEMPAAATATSASHPTACTQPADIEDSPRMCTQGGLTIEFPTLPNSGTLPPLEREPVRPFWSWNWTRDEKRWDMVACYLERFTNSGLLLKELRSGKPWIAIVQSGGDANPCNSIHLDLVEKQKNYIWAKGGIPFVIYMGSTPLFENCDRPTAMQHRNPVYVLLADALYSNPFDAVVYTTGCDKTNPVAILSASLTGCPSIVSSGGPGANRYDDEGNRIGVGDILWKTRKAVAAGEITPEQGIERVAGGPASRGNCNPPGGTANTMAAAIEALGMSLPGCAFIPAPLAERGKMAYSTAEQIVEMAYNDIHPRSILTKKAFINAIRVVVAIGGSSNAVIHLIAMARQAHVDLTLDDFMKYGRDVPQLVDGMPVGKYLAEDVWRAGGVQAVMHELAKRDLIHLDCMTVNGRTIGENLKGCQSTNPAVIRPIDNPVKPYAGFLVVKGNLFNSAIMKISAVTDDFAQKHIKNNIWEGRAIVFESSEDYHDRINDPSLDIDENCILVIRNCGVLGGPGAPEVVNMQAPDRMAHTVLPVLGEGRTSGTSAPIGLLHASPEALAGGGLRWLKTGDRIRINLNPAAPRCDALVSEKEIEQRVKALGPIKIPPSKTPLQELYREKTTQLEDGAGWPFAEKYIDIMRGDPPPHNH